MVTSKLEQLLLILAATLDSLRNEGYAWGTVQDDIDVYPESGEGSAARVSRDSFGEATVERYRVTRDGKKLDL